MSCSDISCTSLATYVFLYQVIIGDFEKITLFGINPHVPSYWITISVAVATERYALRGATHPFTFAASCFMYYLLTVYTVLQNQDTLAPSALARKPLYV